MPKQTYVVGTEGAIWRRDDHSGSFYDISPNVNSATIWADVMAHNSNPDLVVAVGQQLGAPIGGIESGIVVSQDGGTTWISPAGDWKTGPKIFYDVWIVDDSLTIPTIWVASAYGKMYKSTDGGLTFNKVSQDIGISVPGDIQFTTSLHALSPGVCVVTGYQQDGTANDFEATGIDRVYIWKTTDGGNNWTKLNSGSTYSDRRLINTLSGLAIGYSHGIWISPDQSKIIVSTNYVQFVSTDITLVHANFVSVPQAGVRSNHHMTWYPDHDATPSRFRRTGGAPGPVTIIESIDVGATWAITRPGDSINTIFGAHFYSPQNGYYVQRTSDIYETSNGGVTGTILQNIPGINWTAIHTSEQNSTIYRLENCEGVASDQFVTDPNMAQYVGQVIVIDPPDQDLPATLCWEVYIHDTVVGTYDQPVPILDSFANCADCNPRYYELRDCSGDGDVLYTTEDLSDYVGNNWPLNSPGGATFEISLVPCCGGPVLRFIIDTFNPANVPNWLQGAQPNLPNVIKYNDLCYSIESTLVPYTIGQPPGYIDMPQDFEVTILNAFDCTEATTEDIDCECETIGIPLYGSVVSIDGCGGCWGVREIPADASLPLTNVVVNEDFTDCETCNEPPADPIPVPKPRPVDPGYTTGLCDPAIVEKAKCDFANLMYSKMMSNRFKIEVCCKGDEEKIIMNHEKIRLKLMESEDPTPDPCDPQCVRYELEIEPQASASITYTDCFDVPQTLNASADRAPNLVFFCGLDTVPPTAVVTNPDSSTETITLYPVGEDCVPPAQDLRGCIAYEVRMSNYSPGDAYFDYEDCNGDIKTKTKSGTSKNITIFEFCAKEGQIFNPVGLTTDDTFEQEEVGDCQLDDPTPLMHRYKIEIEGGVDFDNDTIDYTGDGPTGFGQQTIDLYEAKSDYEFIICAVHGTILFNNVSLIGIIGDPLPYFGISITGMKITYLGDC